jgi:hypothetical protein
MDMHGRQKEAKAQHSGLRPKPPHQSLQLSCMAHVKQIYEAWAHKLSAQPFYSHFTHVVQSLHQKHPKAPIFSRSRTPVSQETQGCLLSCRVSFLLRILLLQSQSCEAVQYPGQRVEGHRKNLQSCMTVTEKVIQIGTAWYACIIEV